MKAYQCINQNDWQESVFELVGSKTFLITCGDLDANDFNTMTGGWGMMGILWGRPVMEIVVRPSRHTHSFLEKYPDFTVNFLPTSLQHVLNVCGTQSGRDTDKVKACGLHLARSQNVGSPYFEEAETVLECRTISKSRFIFDDFIDEQIESNYSGNDYHIRYVGQILGIWKKQ